MFTPTPTAVSVGSPSPEVCSVEGRRRRRSIHIVRRVAAARLEQGLVDEISQASRQQLQGIDQVTQSVAEMEKVTQTTAATAEESAAASEELGANADQAMEGRKGSRRLEIRSFRDGEWIVITVSDSGPGIPADLREKVFDPYFTTKRDGTGIGLFFSHRVIAAHGGILTAGKSSFGGAEFRIRLPLRPGKEGT